MNIKCKKCGHIQTVMDMVRQVQPQGRMKQGKKHYNQDQICLGCGRIIIEGKEVPPSILSIGYKINELRRRKDLRARAVEVMY